MNQWLTATAGSPTVQPQPLPPSRAQVRHTAASASLPTLVMPRSCTRTAGRSGPAGACSAPRFSSSALRPMSPMRRRSAGSSSSRVTLGRELIRIVHDACGAHFQEQPRDVFAVEVVRARQNRQSQRRGLQQVVPTDRHQAAARRRRRPQPHRTSAIRQAYRPAALPSPAEPTAGPAADEANRALAQVCCHRLEAIGMSRHQHQQRVADALLHDAACASSTCPPRPRAYCRRSIQLGRVRAARAVASLLAATPSGTSKSNLMLPITCVRRGLAPIDLKRSASLSLCAAMTMPCDSVSRNRLTSRRYRPTERGEIRALASTRGTLRLPHS